MRKAAASNGEYERIAGSYRVTTLVAITVALVAVARAETNPTAAIPGAPWEEMRTTLFPGQPGVPHAIRAESVVERAGHPIGRVEFVATERPRALRETTEMDGVRQVVTLVGSDGWITDPNGVVRPAGGDELASIVLAHAIAFHTWTAGHLPDFQVRADVAGDSAVVHISPRPDGPERRLYLRRDGKGLLLPERLEEMEEGQETVETLEDWRIVAGVRMSFLSRRSTGDPRFDLVIRTTSLVSYDSLPGGPIAAPTESPRGNVTLTDPALARRIALARAGGVPLLKVTVNGTRDLPFLVDTGAAATVLSTDLVTRLHLKARGLVEARGAGGSEEARYVEVDSLELPGVKITGQTLVAVELTGISQALDTRIDGILGYDFLNHFAVEIDDPASNFALFPAGSYVPRAGSVRVPMHLESNVPRVDGVLEGKHAGSFVLDTGNATPMLLHTYFAKAHGFLDRATGSGMELHGVGGNEEMRQITIGSLTLGTLSFANVTAAIAPNGGAAISLESSIGNVGSALFAGRVLAFDYGAGALWVSAAPVSPTPDPAAVSADSASGR